MIDENSIANIKKRLAILHRTPRTFFQYNVGRFTIVIYTYETGDTPPPEPDSILDHKIVHAVLNETVGKITGSISLLHDERFSNYEPIRYNTIITPNGIINIGDGGGMPIDTLCELIRYLHRLNNLTAFI